MAVQTRAIKRRIKSVKNTRKITKAMELVAASKMRKAVSAVASSRPYSTLALATVRELSDRVESHLHPLLRNPKEIKRVLLILITSDRGLAGGFNTNILRKTRELIQTLGSAVEIQTVCIGKRGADAMKRLGLSIIASFVDITNKTKFEEVLPIGRMIIQEFSQGNIDRVLVAYTDFVSAITQKPQIMTLLPFFEVKDQTQRKEKELFFEPSASKVLERMLPRLIETTLYQTVLESAASEHSSRMMAMRSASDSAAEMIDDLTFTFNQARQAGITQEIAEISSGKAALEK